MTLVEKHISRPKVYIIILNWNGIEDTLECLSSVVQLDYLNFEAVVVDNGSTDDSINAITNKFPSIIIIQTGVSIRN